MTRLDTILRLNGNPDKRWQPYCLAFHAFSFYFRNYELVTWQTIPEIFLESIP